MQISTVLPDWSPGKQDSLLLEQYQRLEDGEWRRAALYVGVSVLLGLARIWAGLLLSQALLGAAGR